MIDDKKTKEQLIEELNELRQHILELKSETTKKSNFNITERKRTEEMLRESEEKYLVIFSFA